MTLRCDAEIRVQFFGCVGMWIEEEYKFEQLIQLL